MMDEHSIEDREHHFKNSTDDSESESCSSSFCSGSDSERLPWLECVQSDGSLFYIQSDMDLEPFLEDSLKHTYPVDSWAHIAQTKSKLNAAEKIKKWMKDRKKKVRKSFASLKFSRSEANLNSSTSDLFSNYQSKDVYIDIDPSKTLSPSGTRMSISERLLNLRLGSLEENFSVYDKVSILGIFAGQDVSDVKVGDWLKSVNGIDVNMNNLEEVLQHLSVPSRVKLNIMSPLSQMDAKSKFLPPRHNNLVKELLGDPSAIQSAKLQFQHVPHGLYYLSIEHGTFDNDDVIFKYPNDNTPLFQLKGMFLTLGFMISDVASPPLLSCSVMVQGEIVHVGFIKEEEGIMVLALPASVSSITEVQHFASGLAKLFKYEFGSLSKTFIRGNEETCLDNFLTLYFKHYLSSLYYAQSIFSEPHLLDILPSAHWLPLPNDLKTEIDDILSELESSDFGIDSDGFYGNRRIYNIFGSCLFYKGYLLSSHLPKDDLLDIHLYLHYNHILELAQIQSVSEIIIWKEVFPSRSLECSTDPEFQEEKGRWFLLIVVMQHCVLAALLEDGGCALKVEGYPPPEPFYVEEVQNTLFILQDCGLTAATEKLLHFCMFPVMLPDLFFKENSLKNSMSSIHASNPSIHSSGHNMSSGRSTSHSSLVAEKEVGSKLSRCYSTEKMEDVKRQHLLSPMGPADGESDSVSSYSTGSNENMASFEKRFRSYSVSTGSTSKSHGSGECSQIDKDNRLSHRSCSSLPNLHGAAYTADGACFENSLRMVSGFGNHLFYYLHMDPVEGIFIAPVLPEVTSPGSIQNTILDSFHRCCLNMRTVFERSLRNAEINKANIKTKYGVNNFLQDAYEQGVMFQWKDVDCAKQKGSHHSSHFWVIGRLFFLPEPREVYVCYHDSTAQDIVEMAFRLGFGLSF